MIISVSRRTDIPAGYVDWFFNRLKEGFVLVRNPMNYHQVSKIKLSQDVVDCFVFWTKNPANMIPRLSELEKFNYYFQVTVNGYNGLDSRYPIERNLPELEVVINSVISLSDIIGSKRVIWRYDPIIITDQLTIEHHLKNFEKIANRLEGYVDRCVISFVDDYAKIAKKMNAIGAISTSVDMMLTLGEGISKIAGRHNMVVYTCSEQIDLSKVGIKHGKCIDDELISTIVGQKLEIPKDKNQREACGCVTSIDIGAYNTCGNGCIYCYANHNNQLLSTNMTKHDILSPMLIGGIEAEDVIREREMTSYINVQLRLH